MIRYQALPVATTVGGPIEDLPGFWVFPEVIRSGRFIFVSRLFFWPDAEFWRGTFCWKASRRAGLSLED
jgi:hypothetical protein